MFIKEGSFIVLNMTIRDYNQIAESKERAVFNDPKISEKNKEALKRFLKCYDVSPARKGLFLRHIIFLLREIPDIQKGINDRDLINDIFNKFRTNVKPGYYATIINVSMAFCRWLNDGEKPKGFKDIKNVGKKKQMRDLSPQDMSSWDDGLALSRQVIGTQIRAMLLVQLDAGFRPSEFIDLNYGDVEINRELGITTFNVKKGKTGGRTVACQRCTPHILRWLDEHPTKKAEDPLWIEKDKQGKWVKYDYDSIRWHFMYMAKKLNFKKPIDFYALRHSSCVLDKIDNLPVEVASERHGHSVKFFVDTYGRLSIKDKVDRFARHYDLNGEKEAPKRNITCNICGWVNEPESENCSKCHRPLSLKKALEQQEKDKTEREMISEKLNHMEKILANVVAEQNTMKQIKTELDKRKGMFKV